MYPKVFGWQHLTYLAIFLVLAVVGTYCILKFVKNEKTLTIVIKSIAGALLLAILWNRICITINNGNWIYMIPNSFCGLSSLLLSISVLVGKKDNWFFHFICYLGFIGGLITLIYPDFLGQNQSFLYPATISGLLHHTIMFYLVLIMVITKYFVPTLKKWYYLPLGLACVMTYGLFLLDAVGHTSAMNITTPLLEGTILTWWFTGIMVVALAVATMAIFDYFNIYRKKKNNTTIQANTEEQTKE